MDGYKGTVAGFEFRDATFQSAVEFCFARPPAFLLDLWHCGVLLRNPSLTPLLQGRSSEADDPERKGIRFRSACLAIQCKPSLVWLLRCQTMQTHF
jgi:hypothetical protein